MSINNQNYDRLKWLVLIFLPSFSAFIGGLGHLYNWVDVDLYLATMNLLTAFLGGLIQVSSNHYHKEGDNQYDSSTGD
ncbi:phage holin [Fundicoccus sp. Sow4_F4]|uniref:phage holin n=1 Tax=Fundicoccus sp. Sow4_F4 TaxID=3438783 RepID=UPI003F8F0766